MRSPETVGIPSGAILAFVDRLEAARLCMHGVIVLRNGETVAEGYWAPYTAERRHRMYSISKSITALAVGLLLDDGRLRLDDPVAPYFPDMLPTPPHPYLARTTVRHLLMMATPHSATTYGPDDACWVQTFFARKPTHPPGTIFSYNTAATVVLCALVERISGQAMLEFLWPRLLEPLGISKDIRCIETPEGVAWGGSGIVCSLREMARIAQLCAQGGRFAGRQLISEDFIREATSRQIDNSETGQPGYGYQIWCLPENGFSFYGMGSQFAFCYPDASLVVACVGDTQIDGAHAEAIVRESVTEGLLPRISAGPLPQDAAAESALARRLAGLSMAPVRGERASPCGARISGKVFCLDENPMGIDRLCITLTADTGTLAFRRNGAQKCIPFGVGRLIPGEFPEIYFGRRIGTPAARGYDCLSSAAWIEPTKLRVFVHILDEYLGALRITLAFPEDGQIAVHMEKAAEWFLGDYQGFAGGRTVG